MKKWLPIIVLIACVLFVSMSSLLPLILSCLFSDIEIDHLSDWSKFYANELSYYFYIPQEANILFAKEYYRFPMEHEIIVKFRLPPIKSPKEWIEVIAHKSGLTSKCKVNELLYEEIGVYRKIQYLPEEDLYIAQYCFD